MLLVVAVSDLDDGVDRIILPVVDVVDAVWWVTGDELCSKMTGPWPFGCLLRRSDIPVAAVQSDKIVVLNQPHVHSTGGGPC